MKIFLLPFGVLIIDQISKLWVKENFSLYIPINIIGDFVRITYCENPGIAFGIRVGSLQVVITMLSYIISGALFVYLYRERENHITIKVGLSLILGGALGNLVDRTFMIFNPDNYGGVIDFIDIGISNQLRWYVFNIADSSITCGIILYLIYSIYYEKNLQNNSLLL